MSDCDGHQLSAYALPPSSFGHHRVKNERVPRAVPGNVDEAAEFSAIPCADPARAMVARLLLPVEILDNVVVERLGVERLDVSALESATPAVCDAHDRKVTRKRIRVPVL